MLSSNIEGWFVEAVSHSLTLFSLEQVKLMYYLGIQRTDIKARLPANGRSVMATILQSMGLVLLETSKPAFGKPKGLYRGRREMRAKQ